MGVRCGGSDARTSYDHYFARTFRTFAIPTTKSKSHLPLTQTKTPKPSLFLQLTTADVYDYHPPLPLPDPEAPEQSLGDCSICMDAIEVDPALRGRMDEKGGEGNGLSRHTTSLWAQNARKSYSLAPCHHLFVSFPFLLSFIGTLIRVTCIAYGMS